MSVAFQSKSSTAATASNSVVITKPTGLSVGDLMVSHIGKTGTSATITLLSGWTTILNITNSNHRIHTMYKVADSGDVAASDFTFTGSGTSAFTGGAIYRIDGFDTGNIIDASNSTTWSGSSADVNATITPSAGSLLLMLISAGAGDYNTTTISSQAIATSNPSWTEDYDESLGTNSLTQMCGSHASRPESTATGNTSFSASGIMYAGLVIMVAIGNSSGPANLKTWNGLAKASIKSVNGLAIASVKNINGLA